MYFLCFDKKREIVSNILAKNGSDVYFLQHENLLRAYAVHATNNRKGVRANCL